MSALFPMPRFPRRLTDDHREAIGSQIERLIAVLDRDDGDIDREDGDEDCCSAYDDDPAKRGLGYWFYEPGESEDAEEDDPAGQCTEDEISCGAGFLWENMGPGCAVADPGFVMIRGAYQGTFGKDCELLAADSFECGPIAIGEFTNLRIGITK